MSEMVETITAEIESGFANLGLDPRLVDSLTTLGYLEPTPIQRESIPPLLEGRDLIGLAATGTGKTAAFSLPLVQLLAQKGPKRARPAALVLVPTRELAMQVAEAVHRYGQGLGISVMAICGGEGFGNQVRLLKRGVDVVVATPGRTLDHVRRGTMALEAVSCVVLDEADEMLDMGFAEDLDAILTETPKTRQTMLFSATMPPRISAIAKKHLTNPVNVKVVPQKAVAGSTPKVRQTVYYVSRAHKLSALVRILDVEAPTSALVFCRTRTEVDELTETLRNRGYHPEAIHGGMSQEQRTRVMRLFRAGSADLLIATDVAARGLDIDQLSHVVNYDVPTAPESYVHRIGRVGRAGRDGIALTLAEPRERGAIRMIERLTGRPLETGKVPSVADLQNRRLEMTEKALRTLLQEGDLDSFLPVINRLNADHDLSSIAMAALKLAHQAGRGKEEEEGDIPTVNPDRGTDRGNVRGPRTFSANPRRSAGGSGRNQTPGMTRIFFGAGRIGGITPRDLVGAIANEAGVPGTDIGLIDIAERFSLVEVPEDVADYVVDSLSSSRIKGRKVTVRLERF